MIKKSIKRAFVLLFVLGITVFVLLNNDGYKLFKKGYNINQINTITANLKSEDVNILLQNSYNKYILKIINNKNFKLIYFTNYLELIEELGRYDTKAVDIVNEKYFKRNLYKRYANYYKNNPDMTSREIVENVNCNLDYEYYTLDIKADLNKKNLILVNKYYKLDRDYEPNNLVTINKKYGRTRKIDAEVYKAFIEMYEAIEKENMNIYITSPYRSYNYQENLYNNYVKENGQTKADTFSARAGYSEHQTALAIDIAAKNSLYTKFATTKEYKWMLENCYKYGFILRYPENKEKQTGYMFESWHYRYVGKKVAKYIYESGITYDEYYEYFMS